MLLMNVSVLSLLNDHPSFHFSYKPKTFLTCNFLDAEFADTRLAETVVGGELLLQSYRRYPATICWIIK